MNISEVAKQTGLTSKTIRFYEQKGLVTAPFRADNGYRHYTKKHLDELMFLSKARKVGFNLEECHELLNLFHNPTRHSADVKTKTLEKITELEQQIKTLQQMKQELIELANICPGDEGANCPIIDKLSGCVKVKCD